MSDFDYGNARLRAMKSRLLSRAALEGLAGAGSVRGLITALTNTAYREAIEAALVRLAGMECLAEALRNDLAATVGRTRAFFPGNGLAGRLAATALRRYDLHNVKAVLRGLARHVPADEILASTLSAGELRPADLTELARAPDFLAAIDLLATWRMPLAAPLLERRAERREGGLELPEVELSLDRWHLGEAIRAARQAGEEGRPLLEALVLEADAANFLTALRVVGVPDMAAMLRQHYGADRVESLFVGPGRISFELLARAAGKASVPEAVSVFAGTPYGPALSRASEDYAAAGRLSAFEQALAYQQLQHAASLLARDPLGIGVLLGYVALKTSEVANVRAIAHGLMLGDKPDRIRGELMIAD